MPTNDHESECEKLGAGGVLVLVVGPSGAGKDTLIAAARTVLAHDDRFQFARRIITRESHDASESHDVMTPEAFDRAEREGAFFLSWRAHEHSYAIPKTAVSMLAPSRVLVANVSRSSIAAAEAQFARVAVIHVTAPLQVLAQRIAARGREPAGAIAGRLARESPLTVRQAEVVTIVNDSTPEAAIRHFIKALVEIADRSPESAR